MLRKILGAIAGYIVIFIVIFATFSGAYLVMGADKAFEPGTYNVSMTWIAISFVLGFIATVIGGYVAALIGTKGAVKILAGIVLVMGLVTVAMVAMAPKPGPRTPAVSNLEAMGQAQQPLWLCIANPILGIIGVMVGGSLRKKEDLS